MPRTTRRIRRAVLLCAVVGLTTGAGLVTAGAALAGVGAQPGDLELMFAGAVVTSGPLTQTPTWKTTTACPTGHQMSAQMVEFTTRGTLVSRISPTQGYGLAGHGFTGSLDGTVGALLNTAGITAAHAGTLEWAIGCWNGLGGTGTGSTPVVYEQSTFVTATSAGTYTTSSSAPTGRTTPTTTPTSVPVSVSVPPTATPTATATPTSSVGPLGGAQTGAGGASLPGGGNGLLIALGATLMAGSAAAAGLAVGRTRARTSKRDGSE
jgi:hypothetical protein